MRIYFNSKEACKRLKITDAMLKHLADIGKIDYLIRPEEVYYDVKEFLENEELLHKLVSKEQQDNQKDL
jgi:hypothetical protein